MLKYTANICFGMVIFCCNSADGFMEYLHASQWHTVELLRQTEQSRRDIHIENETLP